MRLPVFAEARESLWREHDRVLYGRHPDGKYPDDPDHRHSEHHGDLRRAEHGRAPAGARVKGAGTGRSGVASHDGGALRVPVSRDGADHPRI